MFGKHSVVFKPIRLVIWVACLLVVFAQDSVAQSVGSMATNAKNDLASLPGLIVLIAGIVGLVLAVLGLLKFSQARHSGEDTHTGIRMLVIGVLLLSISAIIGAISVTSYGSNQTSSTLSTLNANP